MIQKYKNEYDMKKYFDKIFSFSKEVPYVHKEITGEAPFLKYRLRYQKRKLALYGAGGIGFITLVWLDREGIQTEFIIDADETKQGKELLGVPIVGLNYLEKIQQDDMEYIVLISANLGMEANDVKRRIF